MLPSVDPCWSSKVPVAIEKLSPLTVDEKICLFRPAIDFPASTPSAFLFTDNDPHAAIRQAAIEASHNLSETAANILRPEKLLPKLK
jgi:hypothetical protein